ncbi:CopG family transcriptional regulator [Devosia riboflavina]|uniref:CopG family transcriptional regulator n=1 Tax=Devosia riboflavina TaxID=46914 RepID=A0A087M526_9HYPH|nr:CopG family ribbon-helix-helix protein [Devosia riboflavina]KFL31979.1 CopG family transcriptional regulator [Devosia riboflavina]
MAVSVKLDDDLRERIQSLAESKQRSAHWIMREAIRGYVEREEARRQFDEDTLASWKHYQETGLHLTGEEVFAWMETWGTDEETDAPPCHT